MRTMRWNPAQVGMFLGALLMTAGPGPAAAALDLLKTPARQSPRAPTGLMLAAARAGDRIVAAGERGIVVYSDDEGRTWSQANVPVSVTLTALYFVSRERGWAAGHDGAILATSDGGASWTLAFDGNAANALLLADAEARVEAAQRAVQGAGAKQTDADQGGLEALQSWLEDIRAGAEFGPSRPLLGLWFRDDNEGLAVGAFGQLFRTSDGGRTWESGSGLIDNREGLHFNAIARLADGSLVISGEAGKLRRSRDDGATWTTLDTGYSGHLYGALSPEAKVLLTYGFAGTVARSDDDGRTWTLLPRLTDKPIIGGAVLRDGVVVLATRDRRLLVSRDAGRTFELGAASPGRPIAALVTPAARGRPLLVAGVGGISLLDLEPSVR